MGNEEVKPAQAGGQRAWIGYVAPMALFLVITSLEGVLPGQYVWIYIAKVVLVTACLVMFRETWRDYRFDWRVVLPAALVGIFVFLIWIPVDHLTPYHLEAGQRTGLNPFTGIHDPATRILFLTFRFFGLALMVPFMEELFWRSFLLRYVSDPDDFRKQPIGVFTWGGFAMVAAAFALAHPEWLSALICAVAYGLLLWRTRSLFATFLAHALTNLLLGIYILSTGPVQPHNWMYW